MTVKQNEMILKKLDTIATDVTNIKVGMARVEEHVKGINGSVARHEKDIEEIGKQTQKNTKFRWSNHALSGATGSGVTIIAVIAGKILGLI